MSEKLQYEYPTPAQRYDYGNENDSEISMFLCVICQLMLIGQLIGCRILSMELYSWCEQTILCTFFCY